MSPEDKSRLMTLLPKTRLCMHYGLTEASRSAFIELHEARAADRLDSVGRPAPGVELRVADQTGASVRQGERGRILVMANTLMSSYWRDDPCTMAAFQDGWLISGDIGRFDDSGWLYLAVREKDLVNVGGREVSPKEIELILEELDNVAACACVGVPDPQGIPGWPSKPSLYQDSMMLLTHDRWSSLNTCEVGSNLIRCLLPSNGSMNYRARRLASFTERPLPRETDAPEVLKNGRRLRSMKLTSTMCGSKKRSAFGQLINPWRLDDAMSERRRARLDPRTLTHRNDNVNHCLD